MNKSLNDEEVNKLASHLSIDNFRNNPSVNQHELREVRILNSSEQSFVRNGKSVLKGWQKEYTPDIAERVEIWINEHLQDTTLKFPEF